MQGKKRVYVATEKLELLCKGVNDGFLEEGDAVYVLKRYKIDDKSYFDFRVIKFFETDKELNTYTCEVKYFRKMFNHKPEKKSSVEGDVKSDSVKDNKPINYKVPALTTIGGATLGYLIGKKFGGATKWTLGGLIVGLSVGVFLINKKNG